MANIRVKISGSLPSISLMVHETLWRLTVYFGQSKKMCLTLSCKLHKANLGVVSRTEDFCV